MNFRIGIYDLFANILPGIIYIFEIAYTCSIFGLVKVDLFTLNLSITQLIIIIVLAYVIGAFIDPISARWYYLFRSKDFPQQVFESYKRLHPHIKPKFKGIDWPILLAKIKLENIEVAWDIERFNATNIMLRNLGFALLVFTILEIVIFINTNHFIHIILAVVTLLASILAMRRSISFAKWYYLSIFETTTAIEKK